MYEDTSWIEDDCPDTFFYEFIILFPLALQLLCVMISHWLTVLKHKMPSQILIKTLDWFGKCCAVVTTWSL